MRNLESENRLIIGRNLMSTYYHNVISGAFLISSGTCNLSGNSEARGRNRTESKGMLACGSRGSHVNGGKIANVAGFDGSADANFIVLITQMSHRTADRSLKRSRKIKTLDDTAGGSIVLEAPRRSGHVHIIAFILSNLDFPCASCATGCAQPKVDKLAIILTAVQNH